MYVMNEIQSGRKLVEIVKCISKPIKCMKVKARSDSSKSLTVDFEWIWMIWDDLNHFWYCDLSIYCLVYYDKVSKILLFLNTIVMQSLLLNIYLDYCQIPTSYSPGTILFSISVDTFDPSIGR